MAISTTEFWRLLAESRLRSAADCQKLQDRFAKNSRSADNEGAVSLAQWLISQRAISNYHARVLLSGRAGPFFYGPYQLRDRLTTGRLAGCFRAVHRATRHPVLLWFFNSAISAGEPYRIAMSQLTAAVRAVHPWLARVHQIVEVDNFKFAVLEDLTGATAQELLAGRGRLRPARACQVMMQIALATAELHKRQIIHGDIRPDNIWIDDKRNGHLLQLPLSRAPHTFPAGPNDATSPEALRLARADYAAPELAVIGNKPGVLSDIYAVGCSLYGLLSGRAPFAGGSIDDKLKRHATLAIEPLESLGIVNELAKVVAFAMAKDPALRYQTAAQLAEALAFFADRDEQRLTPERSPTASEFDAWLTTQRAAPPTAATEQQTGIVATEPKAAAIAQIPAAEIPTALAEVSTEALPAAAVHEPQTVNTASPKATPDGVAIAAIPGSQFQNWAGVGDLFVTTAPETGSATARVRAQRRRARNQAIFLVGLLIALGLGAGIGYLMYGRQDYDLTQSGAEKADTGADEARADDGSDEHHSDASEAGQIAIPDDGKTLWISPTSGSPISWAYLPARAEIVLAIRPSALLQHEEGQKIIAAVGPEGEAFWAELQQAIGTPLDEVEQVLIAWTKSGPEWKATYVVRPAKPSAMVDLSSRWKELPTATHGGASYFIDGKHAYFVPPAPDIALYVVADAEVMPELIESGRNATPLVRELVKLLETSDGDRLASLLFTKSAMLVDAEADFNAAGLRRLYQAIAWFLRDNSQAAAVSLHVDQNCYLEARVVGNVQSSTPNELAAAFSDRIKRLAPEVEDALTQIGLEPYGAKVLIRLGPMMRFVERQLRVGVEGDQVVVNGYLPATAAHNLALAGELIITRAQSDSRSPAAAAGDAPKTVAERLQKVITVVQTGDTLEKALQTISGEIGVPIEIQGGDFVSEGITRNNRFDVQASGVPAAEAIRIVLLKANPDGKLVYLVKPRTPGGEEAIFITTRSAAQKRGDMLPKEFSTPTTSKRGEKTTKK